MGRNKTNALAEDPGKGKKKEEGGGDLSGVAENLGSVLGSCQPPSLGMSDAGPSLPHLPAIRGQDEKLPSSPLLVLV